MILIGQFDSPFVRRIGLTLELYGMAYEHRPWSVFGDADRLAAVNPLIRVPTLVLDGGEAMVETAAIVDYLDSLVPADVRLLPQQQPARRRALQVIAVASGLSDLAVRLFYEQRLHDVPSTDYLARLTRQMTGALDWLEKDRGMVMA
jgi:glutathione S-transferase